MSHEDELKQWRDRYEGKLRDQAVAGRTAKPTKDAWGKPIHPEPTTPDFHPERPVCVLRVVPGGFRLAGPRTAAQGLLYDLEGAIAAARVSYSHELGATLEIRDEEDRIVRTVSWDGDGKPYPQPWGSHSA